MVVFCSSLSLRGFYSQFSSLWTLMSFWNETNMDCIEKLGLSLAILELAECKTFQN